MKIVLSGSAAAAVLGILLGTAMQPHLDAGDGRPAGPQMYAAWSGTRSTGPFDPGTTFASYTGPTPDYVLGTDWKRSMAWPEERAAVSAPRQMARNDDPPADDAPVLTRAAYEDPAPPRKAAGYPSLGGDQPDTAPKAETEDAAPVVTG